VTAQLDPDELVAPDQYNPYEIDEWELLGSGAACNVEDTECEACQ